MRTFAPVKTKGSLAQLNRAFDYGSKGCGFESRRSHFRGQEFNKFGWLLSSTE